MIHATRASVPYLVWIVSPTVSIFRRSSCSLSLPQYQERSPIADVDTKLRPQYEREEEKHMESSLKARANEAAKMLAAFPDLKWDPRQPNVGTFVRAKQDSTDPRKLAADAASQRGSTDPWKKHPAVTSSPMARAARPPNALQKILSSTRQSLARRVSAALMTVRIVKRMALSQPPNAAFNPQLGFTPLHWAASHNQLGVLRLLISCPLVDLEPRTLFDGTPLSMALQYGQLEAARILVEAGARVDLPVYHKRYRTPLSAVSKEARFLATAVDVVERARVLNLALPGEPGGSDESVALAVRGGRHLPLEVPGGVRKLQDILPRKVLSVAEHAMGGGKVAIIDDEGSVTGGRAEAAAVLYRPQSPSQRLRYGHGVTSAVPVPATAAHPTNLEDSTIPLTPAEAVQKFAPLSPLFDKSMLSEAKTAINSGWRPRREDAQEFAELLSLMRTAAQKVLAESRAEGDGTEEPADTSNSESSRRPKKLSRAEAKKPQYRKQYRPMQPVGYTGWVDGHRPYESMLEEMPARAQEAAKQAAPTVATLEREYADPADDNEEEEGSASSETADVPMTTRIAETLERPRAGHWTFADDENLAFFTAVSVPDLVAMSRRQKEAALAQQFPLASLAKAATADDKPLAMKTAYRTDIKTGNDPPIIYGRDGQPIDVNRFPTTARYHMTGTVFEEQPRRHGAAPKVPKWVLPRGRWGWNDGRHGEGFDGFYGKELV